MRCLLIKGYFISCICINKKRLCGKKKASKQKQNA